MRRKVVVLNGGGGRRIPGPGKKLGRPKKIRPSSFDAIKEAPLPSRFDAIKEALGILGPVPDPKSKIKDVRTLAEQQAEMKARWGSERNSGRIDRMAADSL